MIASRKPMGVSVLASSESLCEEALRAGVPRSIVDWVRGLARSSPRADVYRLRLKRFVDHWRAHPDDEEPIASAWRDLSSSARSSDDLISLFSRLPDAATDQPFENVVGRRVVDPQEEQQRYRDMHAKALALAEFLNPQNTSLRNFLRDLSASPETAALATEVREHLGGIQLRALLTLADGLGRVDSFAKVPTKQWAAADRAESVYTSLVADLVRFLKTPKWAALARLATINCPSCPVTAGALRKRATRQADKTG